MANPLDKYFENSALVKYGQVVAAVLSGLKVSVEGKLIRLPIEYQGGIKNQDVKSYSVSQGLSSTLKFLSISIVPEAVPNRNKNVILGERVEKPPLPIELTYEYRLRFKKFSDMAKALEQVVFHFYPHLTLKYEGMDRGTENLVISVESYDWDNEWNGSGEEPSYYDLMFNMVVSGGSLYGRNLLEDNDGTVGIIKQVDIQAGLYNYEPRDSLLLPLFTVYDEEVVTPRFRSSIPLERQEGAYSVSGVGTIEPTSIVIGSYNWIREGY